MSNQLSNASSKEFDTMVKQSYQARGGKIRPTIIQRTGVIGSSYNFRLMKKGMAQEKRDSSALLSVMNIGHELVSVNLRNYVAAEYTDIFDQAEVNFDEKNALAESVAMAIKRREDQMIIDSFFSANLPRDQYIGNNVSGKINNLTVEAVLKAGEMLDEAHAYGQKYMLITPSMRSSLLRDAKTTQNFYVDVKALITGQIDVFAGFKFIIVESTRSEGGLPRVSTAQNGAKIGDSLAFAYVEKAAGIAIGIDLRTEVTYVPNRTSWLTSSLFRAGAAVIDNAGLVKIFCKS